MTALLEVRDLTVSIVGAQTSWLLRGVDFTVGAGEVLALVGESGAGKSATALALAALHPPSVRVDGSVRVRGEELVGRKERDLERLRGSAVGVVFQDPSSALHPLMRVGAQLVEGLSRGAASRAEELLGELGIADPPRTLSAYPHELSGGMRQRALVAMALLREPSVLVLDEATTALDAITRLRVVEVVRASVRARGSCAVLLTHDLALARHAAERVEVLYAGRIVEAGPTAELLTAPQHPYAAALVACAPSLERDLPADPIPGVAPTPREDPAGCAFAPRCSRADERCLETRPELALVSPDLRRSRAACHHPLVGQEGA